jgi:hypothetical protein
MLGLLLAVLVILAAAPACRRAIRRVAEVLGGRREGIPIVTKAGRRERALLDRIVEEVARRSQRTASGVVTLPDVAVVKLCAADMQIVRSRQSSFVDELNHQWRELAAAEDWVVPARLRVEFVASSATASRRPRVELRYLVPQDSTPLERGPYLLMPDHRRVDLALDQPVTLGRGGADVLVDRKFVSRLHAAFTVRSDGGVEIEDLGSANKTYVDGVQVESVVVYEPARIGLGRQCELELRWAQ